MSEEKRNELKDIIKSSLTLYNNTEDQLTSKRDQYAGSIKKLRVACDQWREHGFPVSVINLEEGYLGLTYRGHHFVTILTDEEFNITYPLEIRGEDLSTSIKFSYNQNGLVDRDDIFEIISNPDNSKDLETAKATLEIVKEQMELHSKIVRRKDNKSHQINNMLEDLETILPPEVVYEVGNEEDFVKIVTFALAEINKHENLGLFTSAMKKITDDDNAVTYERVKIGGLYDPNLPIVEKVVYPKPKGMQPK